MENYIVVDIKHFQNKIDEFRMLRNKAIEEKSFETAQWIEGKITAIKEIIGDSTPLEVIVSDVFDAATTGMHFGYDNSKDKEDYISNFTIHLEKDHNEDDDYPKPNESLKSAKERYDRHAPPYVSDDFQIGPDGAYENVDKWDSEYMDDKNEDTWFDELDINPHWKKNLKKFNLSPEVWNVICRLHYGETIALKQSMEEQSYLIHKYNNLKKNIKNLLD